MRMISGSMAGRSGGTPPPRPAAAGPGSSPGAWREESAAVLTRLRTIETRASHGRDPSVDEVGALTEQILGLQRAIAGHAGSGLDPLESIRDLHATRRLLTEAMLVSLDLIERTRPD